MKQPDLQRHPVRVIRVTPDSKLEALLDKLKVPGKYTTLDAVARKGCHAAVARPM